MSLRAPEKISETPEDVLRVTRKFRQFISLITFIYSYLKKLGSGIGGVRMGILN